MIESRLVAWCKYGRFYEGDYAGPGHTCPAEGCLDGVRGHYLQKRRMYVCTVCGWATAAPRAECDHSEAEY